MIYQFWKITKILFLAFLLLSLQIAILGEISNIKFNLALVTIIAISSFAGLGLSLFTASFFIITISLLSYDNTIYWPYLLIAYVCNQFNPKNLETKILVAIFYCLIFSPLIEIIYTPFKNNLLNKCFSSTVTNLVSIIIIYFLAKMLLKKRN